jgi:hypothetical protein
MHTDSTQIIWFGADKQSPSSQILDHINKAAR